MGSTGRATGWTWRPSRQYKAYVQSQQQKQQQATQPPQPVNQNNPNVANQAPTPQNTPVSTGGAAAFAAMDDKSMAALINAAKKAVLPNQLADRKDITQQVVFQAGINGKPMVLDRNAFDQFIKYNGLQNQILNRSINSGSYTNQLGRNVSLTPNDISDMLKYSRVNYIGGKVGGQAIGAGTYFDMGSRIGGNTGYGGTTITAVLNPATARVIDIGTLNSRISSFKSTHPAASRAIESGSSSSWGSSKLSVYALAMGYNVIRRGSYHNVIDREALVYLK